MAAAKIRVGVCGHDLKFWYPLQRMLEATGNYEFREDLWVGHEGHDPKESKAILDWADVIVAEWALGNAVYYSRNKRRQQRMIVRLHLQERLTRFPMEIDYANVDSVIFVGAHILRECVEAFPIPANKCQVIGNFVDVLGYNLPKHGDAKFTLGIIGTAPSRKRLDLAVDTLDLLYKRDDRYRLRVKGASPASIPWLWKRSEEVEYYEGIYARINSGPLRHKVIFDPHGADVPHWLQMVGSILSPSDFESFHMAVAEGAASAAFPILWDWEGSEEIYPEFERVSSAEQAASLVDFLNRSASGPRYRQQIREVIRDRYDGSVVSRQWETLLGGEARVSGEAKARSARALIVVWAIDNWGTFHRREMLQALAEELAQECDFLVVEPGNHYEAIAKLGWCPTAELARIANGELIRETATIYRTRLLTGGIPPGVVKNVLRTVPSSPLETLDKLVDRHYAKSAQVLHWVYKPDQAQRLGSGRKFVYEVYDDYTVDFGTGESIVAMVDAESKILPMASHVFFTSEPLLDRKAQGARSSSLVGNGVRFETFRLYDVKRDAGAAGRPVAGYLGNLSDFFDWSLVHAVCSAMPDVDFVFHGQVEKEKLGPSMAQYEALMHMENVRFTGRVSRERGAAAVNRYDVLLIPFLVNEAMHAVNPLKLWEYLATGCPIVTSPLQAVSVPSPEVRYAADSQQWQDAIRDAIAENDEVLAETRVVLAQRHSWESVVVEYTAAIRALLVAQGAGSRSTA